MNLRASAPGEIEALRDVHLDAFPDDEAPAVAQLTVDLLQDETAEPRLSLVAEIDGQLVGHVLFTAVHIDTRPDLKAFILCPMAVIGPKQGAGVGTALIRQGLDTLASQGADVVLVLGDPRYYGRFGFRAGHRLATPFPIAYPEAWQAIGFSSGLIDAVSGVVRCARVLDDPKHW